MYDDLKVCVVCIILIYADTNHIIEIRSVLSEMTFLVEFFRSKMKSWCWKVNSLKQRYENCVCHIRKNVLSVKLCETCRV